MYSQYRFLSKGDVLMDIFTGKRKQIATCLGTSEIKLAVLENRSLDESLSFYLEVLNCICYFILSRYTGESGRTVFE